MKYIKNLYLFFGLLVSFFLVNACNNAINSKTDNKNKAAREIEVIYENCTVYAGSTKYYFKPAEGELIEVSVLNKGMEDEEIYRIKIPKNLIDDSKDLEGPPGPNPKMIGKKFKLIYNENDEVIEVRPL